MPTNGGRQCTQTMAPVLRVGSYSHNAPALAHYLPVSREILGIMGQTPHVSKSHVVIFRRFFPSSKCIP